MKKYYKVYTDFTNYIPIDESELEKALRGFHKGAGAIFEEGATKRIEVILPDYVRMMGWNRGYKPEAFEQAEIDRNPTCIAARVLLASIKEHLATRINEPYRLAEKPYRIYTNGPTDIKTLAAARFNNSTELAR